MLAVMLVLGAVAMTACSAGNTPADNDQQTAGPADNSGANTDEPAPVEPAKAKGNFEVPEAGYDGSEVTITFYHTMGTNLSDVLDLYIAEFNKLYPNIHIDSQKIGSYDDVRDQVSTEITVGTQPNIAYCYPDHVALYNLAGAVATLDNLIDSQIEVARADGSTEILGLTDEQKADFIPGRPAPVRFRHMSAEERKALVEKNSAYGRVICRCETITEGEILDAIHAPAGAIDVDGVKRRTRAGMGRCQGGFCGSKVVEILARELGQELDEITKCGGESKILFGRTK